MISALKCAAVLAPLSLSLSGCGFVSEKAAGTLTPKRGAALLPVPDLSVNTSQGLVNYYTSSFSTCMSFKEGLMSATTGVNAGSDYATLILNALGAVVAPVTTVHMLAAGAAATTGLKSTFATDVATDNAVNLTIAFDKIYFQPMARLAMGAIPAATTPSAAIGVVSQIVSLQAQCSLDEARAYINLNLNQSAARTADGQMLR